MRHLLLVVLLALFAGCSKDNFRSVPTQPVQPPVQPPVVNPPIPPVGQQPPINYQPPQGYNQNFQLFAPIYYYMQQNYQLQQQWLQMWQQWQMYAYYRGYNQYDFDGFWFDYCAQSWQQQPAYNNLYLWFDVNVYSPGGYGYCGECWY